MKVGVLPLSSHIADPAWLTEFAAAVERTAAESVWMFEHVALPSQYRSVYPFSPHGKMGGPADADLPDPLQWLQHLAALTDRVRLATGLMILPLHHPLILAKRLATLDRLSRGRVIAGFGIGWLAEEYAALGVPFTERGRRADEALQVLRAAWAPGASEFAGRYHSFRDLHVNPKPVDPAGVPIVLGGGSRAAMRRAAHWGDGVFLLGQDLAHIGGLLQMLYEEADAIGRPREQFEITVDAPADRRAADRLRSWHVDRVVVAAPADDLDTWERTVDRRCQELLEG